MEYKLIASRKPNITLLEQILYNRGFETIEDIQHFLNVDENDLYDPLLLDNMRAGVEMLAKHISNNDNAIIVVD